jgi:hypothetical protein
VIYVGIVGVVLVSATLFAAEFASIQLKASLYRDVQRNASLATQRIEVELREASAVNIGASTFGDPGVLSLETTDGATDPTVFSVTDGVLYVQQGSDPALPLTDSGLEVRAFDVENLSNAGRTRAIRVIVTIGSIGGETFQDIEAESTMSATGRVRIGDGFQN